MAELGVPLLAEEVAELRARGENARKVVPVVQTYGDRHPEAFAGMFVDSAAGGNVIVQLSDHFEEDSTPCSTGHLQAGGDAADGEPDQTLEIGVARVVGGKAAEPGEPADLELGEGVDVGVAEGDLAGDGG